MFFARWRKHPRSWNRNCEIESATADTTKWSNHNEKGKHANNNSTGQHWTPTTPAIPRGIQEHQVSSTIHCRIHSPGYLRGCSINLSRSRPHHECRNETSVQVGGPIAIYKLLWVELLPTLHEFTAINADFGRIVFKCKRLLIFT